MTAKKWTAAAMAMAMTIPLVTACGGGQTTGDGGRTDGEAKQESTNVNPTGFPIVKEPVKMTFLAPSSATPDWNDVLVFNEYKKMTNMDIQWQMISSDALKEKTNLMLAGGDYPDAFHSAGLSTKDLINYGGQGTFIPLNDLIDQYAPNFKKLLEEHPDIKRGLTMPDGNIYSFPRIFDPEFHSVLMGWKLWLNKDFLDNLGMKEPETLDEFYEFLKAVKEKDPNGNGQADEFPLSTSGDTNLLHLFKGSFGLGNRGVLHPYVDVDPSTNELRFIPADDRFKEMLQYLNKLYKEGLINQDLYTVKSEEIFARGSQGLFGAAIVTNPRTAYNQDNFIGAPVFEGPHGDKLYSNYKASLVNIGAFVITDKNPDPAATVRWVDYFYGDEGSKLFFMGLPGQTYVENPDGTVDYSDLINKNPDGLTYTQAISKYLTWRTGGYPAIVKEQYFKGSEGQPDSIEATRKVEKFVPEEVWAPFNFTVEESEKMATLGADIENYVKEMQAKFIIGQASFDQWDKFVETLNKMGLDKYMAIYNDAYKRYQEAK